MATSTLKSKQIEHEMSREYKLIGNLSLKQLLAVIAIVIINITSYLLIRNESFICISVFFCAPIGFLGFFKSSNGLNIKDIINMMVSKYIYNNGERKYRSKNKYIAIMNTAYKTDKKKIMSSNQKAYEKAEKKHLKEIEKRKKISKYKSLR